MGTFWQDPFDSFGYTVFGRIKKVQGGRAAREEALRPFRRTRASEVVKMDVNIFWEDLSRTFWEDLFEGRSGSFWM